MSISDPEEWFTLGKHFGKGKQKEFHSDSEMAYQGMLRSEGVSWRSPQWSMWRICNMIHEFSFIHERSASEWRRFAHYLINYIKILLCESGIWEFHFHDSQEKAAPPPHPPSSPSWHCWRSKEGI